MPRACWQEGGEQQRVLSLHQPQRPGAWGEGVVQSKGGAGAPPHHAEPPSLSHRFLLNPSLCNCKLSLLDWGGGECWEKIVWAGASMQRWDRGLASGRHTRANQLPWRRLRRSAESAQCDSGIFNY